MAGRLNKIVIFDHFCEDPDQILAEVLEDEGEEPAAVEGVNADQL